MSLWEYAQKKVLQDIEQSCKQAVAKDMKIISEANHEAIDMPKTNDALMAAMHKDMKGMKKADLQAAYGSMMKMGMHDKEEEVSKEEKEKSEAVVARYGVQQLLKLFEPRRCKVHVLDHHPRTLLRRHLDRPQRVVVALRRAHCDGD